MEHYLEDGTPFEVPDDATDEQILEYAKKAKGYISNTSGITNPFKKLNDYIVEKDPFYVGTGLHMAQSALEGIPIAGNYLQKLQGHEQFKEEHPILDIGSNLAGGILSTAPLSFAVAGGAKALSAARLAKQAHKSRIDKIKSAEFVKEVGPQVDDYIKGLQALKNAKTNEQVGQAYAKLNNVKPSAMWHTRGGPAVPSVKPFIKPTGHLTETYVVPVLSAGEKTARRANTLGQAGLFAGLNTADLATSEREITPASLTSTAILSALAGGAGRKIGSTANVLHSGPKALHTLGNLVGAPSIVTNILGNLAKTTKPFSPTTQSILNAVLGQTTNQIAPGLPSSPIYQAITQ